MHLKAESKIIRACERLQRVRIANLIQNEREGMVVDWDCVSSKSGKTPLYLLCEKGEFELAAIIIGRGASVTKSTKYGLPLDLPNVTPEMKALLMTAVGKKLLYRHSSDFMRKGMNGLA